MTEPRHILIVDDEPGIRSALESSLSALGHRISSASDVEEALAIARRDPPHILLTDLRMEGRTGLELLQILREEIPRIQAVVMTGYGSIEELVRCVRLGAVDFVQKPFRIRQIREAIERCRAQEEERERQAAGESREVEVSPERWKALTTWLKEVVPGEPSELQIEWRAPGGSRRVRLRPSRAPDGRLDTGPVHEIDEVKRLLWR